MAIKRQQIVDAVATRLGTILTTAGYHTNLGSNVFEWKGTKFEAREMPGIDVRDTVDEIDHRSIDTPTNVDTHRLTVMLSLAVDGSTSTDSVREMIADVYKAIGTDPTFGALAIDSWVVKDEVDTEQEELRISGVEIEIAVLYRTSLFQES